jgi:plastocyanin
LRLYHALLSLVGILPCAMADAPPPKASTSGTVAGVVRFTGKVPDPTTITVSDGTTIKHSDLVVDAKTKGLRDVMVMLEDAPAQPKLKDAKPVRVDQVGWVFKPRVVAVQHGQGVRFDNSDSVNHSVMASSTVKENEFNAVAGPGMPLTRVFEPQKPPVLIGCSLHPWMRAWVYVVRHPWFAISNAQGDFRVENVPPGKYTLLLVHPDTNLRERRTIEVQPGKTVQLSVEWSKLK